MSKIIKGLFSSVLAPFVFMFVFFGSFILAEGVMHYAVEPVFASIGLGGLKIFQIFCYIPIWLFSLFVLGWPVEKLIDFFTGSDDGKHR